MIIYKWLHILWVAVFLLPALGYMRYLLARHDKCGAFGVGVFIAFSVLIVWAE